MVFAFYTPKTIFGIQKIANQAFRFAAQSVRKACKRCEKIVFSCSYAMVCFVARIAAEEVEIADLGYLPELEPKFLHAVGAGWCELK